MKKLLIFVIIILSTLQIYSQNKIEQAKDLGNQAIKLINEKKTTEAIDLLKKAQKLDPKSIFYPYEIAVAYYDKEKFPEAMKILDSLKRHPEANEQVFQLLGNCFDYLAKRDEARDIYNEGLSRFPKSGRLYMELGIISIEEDKIQEGLNFWAQGTRVQPNYDNLHYRLAKQYNKDSMDIFALVSAETFLNLSNNDTKINEISKLCFNIYNKSIIKNDSLGYIFSFRKSTKENTYFELAFEMVLNRAAKNIDLSDGLNLEELYLLRKGFFNLWYKDGINNRYGNFLYDYINKVIQEGQFETYNYLIFYNGDPVGFQNWAQSNTDIVKEYLKWRKDNMFKFNEPEDK
ncbi:MAG: hypothetical protein WCR42_02395 [bacterium]